MTTHIGRKKKIVLFFVIALIVATAEAILTANYLVGAFSSQVYSSVNDIPFHEFGLVLGAPEYSDGRINPVLEGRIQAAADLYFAGKVNKLVVSGISRPNRFNDETSAMMQGLIRRGIPQDAIIKDSEGLRTFDSILRMRDSFGYNSFIIVSQRDHCCRALYLAKKNNISAVGFEAGIPTGLYPDEALASLIRESLARVKTVLEIIVTGHVKKTISYVFPRKSMSGIAQRKDEIPGINVDYTKNPFMVPVCLFSSIKTYSTVGECVIWCFSAREFTESTSGWVVVPVTKK